MKQHQTLVLASASPSRRTLLVNAGLVVKAIPADIDEIEVRNAIEENHQDPASLAMALADAKARDVAGRISSAPVIGADQILICDGERMDKAPDIAHAKQHLMRLQGRTHELISAVTVHQGNSVLWSGTDTARLSMRAMTEVDIDRYLDRAGKVILGSVGCYHLEGKGAWLFERIEGDFFTILGLPLLPLFKTLRRLGIVE